MSDSFQIFPQKYAFQSHPTAIEGAFYAQDETELIPGTVFWAYGTAQLAVSDFLSETIGQEVTPWVNVTVPPKINGPIATKVGGKAEVVVANATLFKHNTKYFLNMKAKNKLGWPATGSSPGVLVDLVPPFPLQLSDAIRCNADNIAFHLSIDVYNNLIAQRHPARTMFCNLVNETFTAEQCRQSTLLAWDTPALNGRCIGPTFLPNHRTIVDSGTIFAGIFPNTSNLYQLEQSYITANWFVFEFFFLCIKRVCVCVCVCVCVYVFKKRCDTVTEHVIDQFIIWPFVIILSFYRLFICFKKNILLSIFSAGTPSPTLRPASTFMPGVWAPRPAATTCWTGETRTRRCSAWTSGQTRPW